MTGEHFPKKADLRSYLQPGGFYRHTATERNEDIQGPGSKRLHFGAPLCAHCNNTLTQPYDGAWDILRDYLLAHWPSIVTAGDFDLRGIYGPDWAARAVDLQLYFVKVLGCAAVDRQVQVPLQSMQNALQNRSAQPHLFLTFCDSKPPAGRIARRMLVASDLQVLSDPVSGAAEMVYWRYTAFPLSVRMAYAAPTFVHRPNAAAWHPLASGSTIRLGVPVSDVSVPPRIA